MKLQTRSHTGAIIRMADPTADGRNIVGTAITYGSLSRNLGGFVERFMPGSVSDSVAGGLVCALVNHDPSQPIGDQRAGTLRLVDTSEGLTCEIQTPDTSYARDALAVMKQRGGTGTGMSFGFSPAGLDIRWTKEAGQNVAEVRKAQLGEVSILTGMPPAYAATSCSIRSLSDQGDLDLTERYGIDLDSLASAFTAIKRGLALTDHEEQAMQLARKLFSTAKRPLLSEAENRAAAMLLI